MHKYLKNHFTIYFNLLFLMFMSLNSLAQETLRERMSGKKLVAAHQGGLFDGAPNTLPLFEQTRMLGADIIEFDLLISKDGVPMVFHDKELGTMTDCDGKVKDFNAEELKKCNYKMIYGEGSIPTFEDVLIWNNNRIIINAEFKDHEVIAPAIELVKKHNALNSAFFQTKGDTARYNEARAISKEVNLLFAPGSEDALNWALSLNDNNLLVIELHENLRDTKYISQIQKAGKFALEDSWHWRYDYEFLGTSCDYGFYELNYNILVTNRPESCIADRDNQ